MLPNVCTTLSSSSAYLFVYFLLCSQVLPSMVLSLQSCGFPLHWCIYLRICRSSRLMQYRPLYLRFIFPCFSDCMVSPFSFNLILTHVVMYLQRSSGYHGSVYISLRKTWESQHLIPIPRVCYSRQFLPPPLSLVYHHLHYYAFCVQISILSHSFLLQRLCSILPQPFPHYSFTIAAT